MTLSDILRNLGISQVELAVLVGVTPRAVNYWMCNKRKVPPPVWAYLNLLINAPKEIRCVELNRIREK